MADTVTTPKPCPICGRPAERDFRPFCSQRCKDVDLHRWFSGVYAVPAVESDDDSEPDSEAAPRPAGQG